MVGIPSSSNNHPSKVSSRRTVGLPISAFILVGETLNSISWFKTVSAVTKRLSRTTVKNRIPISRYRAIPSAFNELILFNPLSNICEFNRVAIATSPKSLNPAGCKSFKTSCFHTSIESVV